MERMKINDGLSELPEEIISNILSRLSTEEAARTSVLSKQWRYYWTNIHSLNFCNSNPYVGRLVLDKFVTNVFCRRQPWRLSKLSIHFHGNCSELDMEEKIISLVYDYAISHQIEELDTDHDVGSFEFRTLKTLRLRYGCLSDLHGFTSLTVLELYQACFHVTITDDIFSNCLNLEKLVIIRCIGGSATLCISSPGLISLQIKDFYSENGVAIKSPKLELCELELVDARVNLRIDDCPALDNANIHICFLTRPGGLRKAEFVNPGFSALCDVKSSHSQGRGFSAHCDVKLFYSDFVSASKLVKICRGMSYARLLTMWLRSAGGSRILYKHDVAVANSSLVTAHLFAETLSAPDVRRRWGRWTLFSKMLLTLLD